MPNFGYNRLGKQWNRETVTCSACQHWLFADRLEAKNYTCKCGQRFPDVSGQKGTPKQAADKPQALANAKSEVEMLKDQLKRATERGDSEELIAAAKLMLAREEEEEKEKEKSEKPKSIEAAAAAVKRAKASFEKAAKARNRAEEEMKRSEEKLNNCAMEVVEAEATQRQVISELHENVIPKETSRKAVDLELLLGDHPDLQIDCGSLFQATNGMAKADVEELEKLKAVFLG